MKTTMPRKANENAEKRSAEEVTSEQEEEAPKQAQEMAEEGRSETAVPGPEDRSKRQSDPTGASGQRWRCLDPQQKPWWRTALVGPGNFLPKTNRRAKGTAAATKGKQSSESYGIGKVKAWCDND